MSDLHSNRSRNLAFRNEVILFLRDCGHTTADSRSETKGLPFAERQARDTGDIVGLPWVLGVRCQQVIDLSGSIDEAATEAERAAVGEYASIQRRKGHPTEDAYVTMPLKVFSRVLHAWPDVAAK